MYTSLGLPQYRSSVSTNPNIKRTHTRTWNNAYELNIYIFIHWLSLYFYAPARIWMHDLLRCGTTRQQNRLFSLTEEKKGADNEQELAATLRWFTAGGAIRIAVRQLSQTGKLRHYDVITRKL